MKLIIKTNPEDWDDSLIVAQGITKDGYALSSSVTRIKAKEMALPYFTIWRELVESFKAGDDGGIVCVMATAGLSTDEDGLESIRLELFRQWPDGRNAPMEIAVLTDDNAAGLVRYLLSAAAYDASGLDGHEA